MTFVASSGDNGVASGSYDNEACIVDGQLVDNNPGKGAFVPNYPASCPYVTAVGATQLPNGSTVHDPEVATTAFASGGGFSNVFARPFWQEAQVSNYLEKYNPPYGPDRFNRSGRAYPDVAANE